MMIKTETVGSPNLTHLIFTTLFEIQESQRWQSLGWGWSYRADAPPARPLSSCHRRDTCCSDRTDTGSSVSCQSDSFCSHDMHRSAPFSLFFWRIPRKRDLIMTMMTMTGERLPCSPRRSRPHNVCHWRGLRRWRTCVLHWRGGARAGTGRRGSPRPRGSPWGRWRRSPGTGACPPPPPWSAGSPLAWCPGGSWDRRMTGRQEGWDPSSTL